jgi:cytoskeletal protein CcmA (bactofilin family)
MSMFDKRKDSDPPTETILGANAHENRARIPEPTIRGTAMIGKTITIKGDITGEENLVIEGKVDGTVHLKNNDLTVGPSGHVNANLTANVVRIDGEVKGDISGVEKVIVTKTGRVHGNIVAPRVTLEDGAKFKGSIDMDPGGSERALGGHNARPVAAGKPMAVEGAAGEASGKA